MKNSSRTAVILPEAQYDRWDRFVAQSRSGSIYNTAAYLELLCTAAGGSYRILAVPEEDSFAGGIALFEPAGRWRTVSNRLLLYYNGLVLGESKSSYPSEQTAHALSAMNCLQQALASGSYDAVVLHNRAPVKDLRVFIETGWRVAPGYSYQVPLKDTGETWSRIEKNLRRLINRASDRGMALTRDDDFESFYRLHTAVAARKGAPVYLPYHEYRKFVTALLDKGLGAIYHARLNGEAAASQLVLLGAHPVSHTVCAGTDAALQHTGCNPFLRWKAFEDLAAMGYEANDLTDAALNPVTHFKSQLGGELVMNTVVAKEFSARYRMETAARSTLRAAKRLARRFLRPELRPGGS